MTDDMRKKRVLPWAQKLFRPEYHSSQFREKRNKFLHYLTLSLLSEEPVGIVKFPPPLGALPDMESLEKPEFPAAEWELDTTWQETCNNLSEDFQTLTCAVHCMKSECDEDHKLDKVYFVNFN